MAHYINNKEFTQAIVAYKKACKEAEEQGKERPVIPNDIAESFLQLATKLSYRYNFVNYSYRDDFVSTGVLVCCAKILNFDETVTTNAFGYFTKLCFWEFVNVIDEEHKESYVKAKSYFNLIEEHGNPFETGELGDDHEIENDFIPYFDVEEFEKKREKKKAAKKKTASQDGLFE